MAFFSLSNLGLGDVRDNAAGIEPDNAPATRPEGYKPTRGQDENINEASVNSEAALIQGGYNAGIATAVDASRGIGADERTVQRAASDFARMAQDAVRGGVPLSGVRYDDPNLSPQAREAIYNEACQQSGTTPEAIEKKAQEADAATMQQLQQGLGGVIAGAGLSGAMDNMTGQAPAQAQAQPAAQQAPNPLAGLLSGITVPRMPCYDLGSTTAALANGNIHHGVTVGEKRERESLSV